MQQFHFLLRHIDSDAKNQHIETAEYIRDVY